MYERLIGRNLAAARADTPVVFLSGARQVGKSTLAQRAAQTGPGRPIKLAHATRKNRTTATAASVPAEISTYLTFDDATVLAAARSDPQGFLRTYRSSGWVVIDEVQRVPELLSAVKQEVDADRRPGRFLLTGSANVMMIPHVAESLAGRMESLQMWPLAQAEIESTTTPFITWTFGDGPGTWSGSEDRANTIARALKGGYPDALVRNNRSRRNAWFGSYLMTVIQREIESISQIEDEGGIVRILRALASRSGGPRNYQSLSNDSGIAASTITRHVALLRATFLVSELPAWSVGVDARIIRSPKILVNDSGLYGYLLNLSPDEPHVGFLLENFVGVELQKLISFEGVGEYALMHFRTRDQHEVDFVLEAANRNIVGIEVKAATSVNMNDFRGLRALANVAKSNFRRGIVLYCGDRSLPFGANMWAIPFSALWTPPAY